jgi:hypothetical protein
MADLPRDQLDRLIKVLGLLGSNHDGERAAAANLATSILKKHGATWGDLISRRNNDRPRPPPPPPPRGDDIDIDLEVVPDDGMDDIVLRIYALNFVGGHLAGDFDLGDISFLKSVMRANRWTPRQRIGFIKSLRRAWWIRRRAMEG